MRPLGADGAVQVRLRLLRKLAEGDFLPPDHATDGLYLQFQIRPLSQLPCSS